MVCPHLLPFISRPHLLVQQGLSAANTRCGLNKFGEGGR